MRTLDSESYSRLLKALSPDEQAAASSFIKLRESLVRFFQLKGDSDAIRSADETVDRVSAKLGQSLVIEDLTKYAFGVARLIFLENLRKTRREAEALKDYGLERDREQLADDSDPYAWMRDCFAELSDEDKYLLRAYFADLPREKLDAERQNLAASMAANKNTLRLRIFRLRRGLEECIRGKRSAAER